MDMSRRYSRIAIRETKAEKELEITSAEKPEISKKVRGKWQELLDTLADIVGVPSGLIMKLHEDSIEVLLKSNTDGNPYQVGEKAELLHGLYCENVMGRQQHLLVPDARKDPLWQNNPDVELDMIAYLGYPINWPDGEVFGTVCLLDNKENHYSDSFNKLLELAREHIESDLKLLLSNHQLTLLNRELHKESALKTRFLSLISHDVRGGIGTLNEFLKLTIGRIEELSAQQLKRDLSALHEVSSHAFIVLENLLRWSKNDLLQLDPEITEFDLVAMFEDLLDFFRLSMEEKDLQVRTDYYADKIFVRADENMLKTALRNILSNAIKYNRSAGSLAIVVENKEGALHITLEDTGIGMDAATKDQLFTYAGLHTTNGQPNNEGAGIGLLLAKDFLTKNDFSVSVRSRLGEGTAFTLTRPWPDD
jgi:signal transduction histidine kinase